MRTAWPAALERHRPLKMFAAAHSLFVCLSRDVFLMSSQLELRKHGSTTSLCARTTARLQFRNYDLDPTLKYLSKLSSINELPILSMGEFFELYLRNVRVENVSHKVIKKKSPANRMFAVFAQKHVCYCVRNTIYLEFSRIQPTITSMGMQTCSDLRYHKYLSDFTLVGIINIWANRLNVSEGIVVAFILKRANNLSHLRYVWCQSLQKYNYLIT